MPGRTDEQVAASVDEVEAGDNLTDRETEPNPHFQRVHLVPADLLDAIEERARKDGQSPDAVVREALATYLHTA